jgi:sodium/proline symporter
MSNEQIMNLGAMILYLLAILAIGVYFTRRASKNTDEYFLGGRGLGPWVAAFSAEASDMSGWLLMGLPGVAYFYGLADAAWTAIGLAVGTYLNWLIVSKRLRKYSQVAGNSITIPDFFSNRFKEKTPAIMLISSVFILIFFAVYVASCFMTGGKLFAQIFGGDYRTMMVITALIVVAYTLLGGFWAVCVSDFVQALIMVFAIIAVAIAGVVYAGGFNAVSDNIKNIPGFVDFFNMATPIVDNAGKQIVGGGATGWSAASPYGILTICSTMAWGLGYFGMPQVLIRFFAVRKVGELKRARRVAIVWCVIAMTAAVFIGLLGRAIYQGTNDATLTESVLMSASGAENVFIVLSKTLFHPVIAGMVMAGILAAAMSSSDSYLLVASSALAKNIYQGVFQKGASDKQVMWMSRIALCLIAVVSIRIAWNPDSVIFKVVSFAWAGFGAAFGPLMLFSLFWKRTTREGAIAGMLGGGGMVFFWKLVVRELGGAWNIYELLPAFIFSGILIVVVSLLTRPPEESVLNEFEQAKTLEIA